MWSEAAIALTLVCQAAIAVPGDDEAEEEAVNYLTQFGYIETNLASSDSTSFKDAIRNFQDFAGLEKTGRLDEETRELMKKLVRRTAVCRYHKQRWTHTRRPLTRPRKS